MRTAIRWIADGKGDDVTRGTFNALERRRLVQQDSRTGTRSLTSAGRREHARIMSSGDGPEDLKEMFNFLRPRRGRR